MHALELIDKYLLHCLLQSQCFQTENIQIDHSRLSDILQRFGHLTLLLCIRCSQNQLEQLNKE